MSTRKIEGQVNTWEEPIGILRASFCQGTSEVRKAIGHVPATLIIGGKGYTEEEHEAEFQRRARALVRDIMNDQTSADIANGYVNVVIGWVELFRKHGIQLP